MEQIERTLQEADRHSSDSPDIAYYKYLKVFFLITKILETRTFIPASIERLQDSKTNELFEMAFKVLGKAEACLGGVVECSEAEAEYAWGTSEVTEDAIEVIPMSKRGMSLRRSSLLRDGIPKDEPNRLSQVDVPRVPVSALQYCWFELAYHMQTIVQNLLTLQETKPKTKANAMYLKSLHKLTKDAELLVNYRKEVETFQEEAEVKEFQAFNRDDVRDLAKHLTIIDFSIFERITAREWNERSKVDDALKESMDLTRFVEHWVQSEILHPQFPADRAAVLVKLVHLCQELKILHSFNILKAVINGMSSPSINLLTSTWGLLQSQHKSKYVEYTNLKEFCSDRRNYANMRAVLLINPKPCIPYLGILRQDLAAVQTAKRAGLDPSRQVRANWETSIAHVMACQQHSYGALDMSKPAQLMIQHWALSRVWMDQEVLDELAEKREPRSKPPRPEQPFVEKRQLNDAAIQEQEPINKLDEGLVYDLIHERLRSDYKPRENSGFGLDTMDVATKTPEPTTPKAFAHFYTGE